MSNLTIEEMQRWLEKHKSYVGEDDNGLWFAQSSRGGVTMLEADNENDAIEEAYDLFKD